MECGIRIVGGVVNVHDGFIFECEPITDTRDGEDDGEIVFPFHPFLDDLEMEETEKTAPKPLSQGNRRIFLVGEGCIIELVFFEGNGQVFIVFRSDRIDRGEDHRFEFFKAGEGLAAGAVDRV